MEKLKVALVAQKLGVTIQSVYNYFKKFGDRLEGHITKENGKTSLTEEGFSILKSCLPNESQSNGEDRLEKVISGLQKTIDRQQETMEGLFKQMNEERSRHDAMMIKFTADFKDLRNSLENRIKPKELEFLVAPPQKIEAWKPEAPADPLEGLGFFERVWVQVVEPQKMRRFDS